MSKHEHGAETIYTYHGFAYKQNSDEQTPWIISFVAPAEEILEWSSIPRRGKSENGQIGFQRADDEKRVKKTATFFKQSPLNQSPTAIILGLHPNQRSLTSELNFSDSNNESRIRQCELKIKVLSSLQHTDDIALLKELIENKITYRLAEFDDDIEEDELDELDDEIEVNDESQEELDLNYEDTELELGKSLLKDFLDNLDNEQWCRDNIQDLREFAKPATVIDGQHRLLGASSREQDIPFTFCAIYDCLWTEQVFQFTVVNYTAKRIPDQFITANAALSLTRSELSLLKTRFEQANIKVLEYDLMEIVNFNSKSPFYSLVNLSEKNDPHKIGYKTMVKIAKVWHDARHFKIPLVLFPNVQAIDSVFKAQASKKSQIKVWSEKYWHFFFLEFWNSVKEIYSEHPSYDEIHTLWDVGHSQLMQAVVLYELQDCVLSQCSRNMNTYQADSLEGLLKKFRDEVNSILAAFPSDFFATKWKSTGLNTQSGRSILVEALTKLVTDGNFQYKKSTLVAGPK